MIVLSNTLVLTDADDLGPWIGYHNIVTPALLSSTTEEAENPVTNLGNPATDQFWRSGVNTGTEQIELVVDSADELDYVGIASHNWGSGAFPISIEGRLLGNSPDNYTTLVQTEILTDDAPAIFRFEPQILSNIRITIDAGDLVPQAAVFYAGRLLIMPRSVKIGAGHVPLPYGRRRTIVNPLSESGNYLGPIELKQWRESKAEFEHFDETWYRTYFDPFIAARVPFFYAWDPANYLAETGYAWIKNNPEPETSPATKRVDVTLEMAGIAS